ncbi:MAG: hypothetical protein HXK07_03415 [Actinomyces sp.]|uniref:vWA domain-containing protein n=1 Tax=Actinomyces sp. HMSC035G02 TaxID=1739406 RepID=UPI0008A8EF5C|nr:hypothetical protein [Actinomyces sp. HMSC035G02]MBF0938442.1 hypothetical protein [Actinomyces sp.]MBS5722620.1 hypothetical protein [Actinomyces sp.]OHR19778.1 hypothetical protein HMPREF2902_09565 [Actinomyces sp. HMSC035G02]
MRFWWLIPVVLAVVAVATVVGWMLARRAGVRSGKKGWVANTGYLRGLPKYQALVRRTRASLAIAFVCFLIAVIATSVSAGAPVDRYVKHDKSASRDIVLCLDSSGSMLPYDSKIGGAFRQIISHFEGERISLQLWDAYSMTMFPLTDDYDMATDVLQDMSDTIDTGLIQVGGKISGTRELFEYLEPVLDEKQEVSSLVGDGLASCIMGFDHNDKQRSRTILLATDNEVYGSGVYDLSEAIEFAKSQGVTVTALYPGSDISLSSEALQLRDEVRKTGGDFYDASSPSAVDSVVRQIEAEQKEELDSAGKMIETDRPGAALGWTLVGVVSLLGLLAFGRL